jgi:hypothetical protein
VKPSPVVLVALALGVACRRAPPPDENRLPGLRAEHERLHEELDARVAGDSIVQEALAGGAGQIILAVRSSVVQDVLREAARVYFDRMTLDLDNLEAAAKGRLHHDTFLGRMKVGNWRLEIFIQRLEVELRAKTPRLRVVGKNEMEVKLPVIAREAKGRITLRFSWNSASFANLVCRDFEVVRELEGSTQQQEHTIGGTFRLSAGPDSVRVDPVFADDVIRLKVALPDESWAVVREALESQDSFTRCGMLMDPEKVVERLKELAANGFRVKLPAVMFRGFRFPGAFERTARIEGRPVAVGLRTEALEVTPRAMWSRASIGIASNRARSQPKDRAKAQNATVPREPAVERADRERCPVRSRHRPATGVADGGR